MHRNLKAFLDMLAYSEIGKSLLSKSDDGYNVIVGGELFHGYAEHPRKRVKLLILGKTVWSTAAGRYQILSRYFDHYKKQLSLKDFSPVSQDAIAIQLTNECKAMDDIEAGRIESAITKCASRWASLPNAGYGQPEKSLQDLKKAYVDAGGTLA